MESRVAARRREEAIAARAALPGPQRLAERRSAHRFAGWRRTLGLILAVVLLFAIGWVLGHVSG